MDRRSWTPQGRRAFSKSMAQNTKMQSKGPITYVLVALVCLLLTTLVPAASADYLTKWTGSVPVLGVVVNGYPGLVAGESCIAQTSIVYCIGGLDRNDQPTNMTYAAPVTGLGVGRWGRLIDYPIEVAGESCVADLGYIYCIGGFERGVASNSTTEVTPASYFAPLAGLNIGNWTRTTDYPFGVFDQSCTVSFDYVYCIGGIASNSTGVSDVEYAQLSPSGIEQWNSGIPYPSSVSAGSCTSYARNIYCVGGLNGASRATSSVYYISLAGRSLNWTMATNYPNPVAGHSCVIHYPDLYCIGGLNATAYATRGVFFSYLNNTNLRWIPSIFYPVNVQSQSCVTDSTYVYCIGGYDGQTFLASVYFSTIGTEQENSTPGTVTSSTTTLLETASSGFPQWFAAYGSLIVAAGVALIVIIASFTSNRRSSKAGSPSS